MIYAIQTLEIERAEILKRIRAVHPTQLQQSPRLLESLNKNLDETIFAIEILKNFIEKNFEKVMD